MLPASGVFLVASPALSDPHFAQSVVYLVEHGAGGSLGFIVNRPLDVPLATIWDDAPPGLAEVAAVADGGPVDRQKGLLLHGLPHLSGAQAMGPGLAAGGSLAELAARYARGADHTGPRLFLGHSGWSPGQLSGELAEGAWIVRPGNPRLVLGLDPPEHLWKRLLDGGMDPHAAPNLN